jgi:uncharacterized protein
MSVELVVLTLITLSAAVVNGGLGHGFSSMTVPVALLFYPSRILNPALVLVETVINGYVLLMSRRSVALVWRRVLPILAGLGPGILVGAWLLSSVDAAWLRLSVFAVLLPLILFQAAGVRRPLRAEVAVGLPYGAGVGALYAVTTISGPPLALLFNNQGFVKGEFRAALGLIRVAESTLTAIVYLVIGLYSRPSLGLLLAIVPSVLIGIPLGALLVRRLDAETFRRVCMSFDAWVVGFGLSRTLAVLIPASSPGAYGIAIAAVVLDAYLLRAFFRSRRRPHPRQRVGALRPTAGSVA